MCDTRAVQAFHQLLEIDVIIGNGPDDLLKLLDALWRQVASRRAEQRHVSSHSHLLFVVL
jgi:hypothetical protein